MQFVVFVRWISNLHELLEINTVRVSVLRPVLLILIGNLFNVLFRSLTALSWVSYYTVQYVSTVQLFQGRRVSNLDAVSALWRVNQLHPAPKPLSHKSAYGGARGGGGWLLY